MPKQETDILETDIMPTGNLKSTPVEYSYFLDEILDKIRLARYAMLKTVNKELIKLYWHIGGSVSIKMQSAGW